MKREKITDLKKIEELYKSGKISRSTFWRAKKRGYIIFHYHSKQKLSDYELSQDEKFQLYAYCRAGAVNFVNLHLKRFLEYKEMSDLIEDIAHDIYIEVLERMPVNIKQAFGMVKWALKNLSQHPQWYGKYLDFPIRRKEAQNSFKELDELVLNSSEIASML